MAVNRIPPANAGKNKSANQSVSGRVCNKRSIKMRLSIISYEIVAYKLLGLLNYELK